MEKEFNLSEKICFDDYDKSDLARGFGLIYVRDAKEFIKIIKKEFERILELDEDECMSSLLDFKGFINKLAGDKLTEGEDENRV